MYKIHNFECFCANLAPICRQNPIKTPPRCLQEAPRRPKLVPKMAQEPPKRRPRRLKNHPRAAKKHPGGGPQVLRSQMTPKSGLKAPQTPLQTSILNYLGDDFGTFLQDLLNMLERFSNGMLLVSLGGCAPLLRQSTVAGTRLCRAKDKFTASNDIEYRCSPNGFIMLPASWK